MTIKEAFCIIDKFTKALAISEDLVVYPCSLLENSSKQLVIDAYKLYLPLVTDTKVRFNLMNCIAALYQFIPDNEAKEINEANKKQQAKMQLNLKEKEILNKFLTLYVENMSKGMAIQCEIRDYVDSKTKPGFTWGNQ